MESNIEPEGRATVILGELTSRGNERDTKQKICDNDRDNEREYWLTNQRETKSKQEP